MTSFKQARIARISILAVLVASVAAVGSYGFNAMAQSQDPSDDGNATNNQNGTESVQRAPSNLIQQPQANSGPTTIRGSVDISDQLTKRILDSAKVSFADAAETAAEEIEDGQILSGSLGISQGYLVYSFQVVDSQNQLHVVIVDAGNGDILSASEPMYTSPDDLLNRVIAQQQMMMYP